MSDTAPCLWREVIDVASLLVFLAGLAMLAWNL